MCPGHAAARLGLVSSPAGRGTGNAPHGAVNTLSKSALALWFQLWGVSESGLHPLGERLSGPRTGFGKAFGWEEEEEEEGEGA